MLANKLKIAATIGVFSPSSPSSVTASKRFLRGKKFLSDKGFTITDGALTGAHDFYRTHPMLTMPIGCECCLMRPTAKLQF